jgi:glycerol kinase
MRFSRSTALGSALLAGNALKLWGWDITKPSTLAKVNVKGKTTFESKIDDKDREKRYRNWNRAVERAKGWLEESQADSEN